MPKSTRLSSRQKYINRNNKPTEKRLALRYAMIKAHAAEVILLSHSPSMSSSKCGATRRVYAVIPVVVCCWQ